MGKEIVYCVGCGNRLTEDDFERRKAHLVEKQPYCARCRPVPAAPPQAPPPPPPSRTEGRSTGTRRRNTTSHIPRVAPPPPSTRRGTAAGRNRAILIGAGTLAAVVLVVVVVAATRGARPAAPPREEPVVREERPKRVEPRPPETDRSAELDGFLASIRKRMADDPAFEKRKEIEGLLDAALKIAGARGKEVERMKEEYRARAEAPARRPEPPKAPPRPWLECFGLAMVKVQANDYPAAKPLYLEGLATLPADAPTADVSQLVQYVVGLYNLACIYAVEANSRAGDARKEAVDQAFKYLDWSCRGGYTRVRCPCHAQTFGLGHMTDDKDLESLRADPRYAELRAKYSK